MKFGSLFSGVEGFGVGLERAGMECIGQVEQDKQCLSVLARHWPNVKRVTDVRKVNRRTFPVRPDLICGGFPCQDLSVAGRRDGLAGKRSGLFWEMRRVIQAYLPPWFLVENVPGLLSSQEGRDFGLVIASLVELGYGVAWRVLDSQYFGLAQRRERVFIVGSLGTMRCAEVLFEPESVRRDSPPSREAWERVAGTIESRTRGGGFPGTDGACDWHVVTHTHTPDLSLALNQGGYFDATAETYIVGPLQSHQKRHGHAMTTQQAAESGHVVAHTLRAEGHDASEDGTGRGVPLVAFAQNQEGAVTESDVMQTLGTDIGHASARQCPKVRGAFGVRSLTPRECERLQGFSDDHTRWGADGKEISDSARYRMLGNAVSVPAAEWIGRRIMAAVER